MAYARRPMSFLCLLAAAAACVTGKLHVRTFAPVLEWQGKLVWFMHMLDCCESALLLSGMLYIGAEALQLQFGQLSRCLLPMQAACGQPMFGSSHVQRYWQPEVQC